LTKTVNYSTKDKAPSAIETLSETVSYFQHEAKLPFEDKEISVAYICPSGSMNYTSNECQSLRDLRIY